ncbi:MAG TPA: glutathione S-transferase family protein [Gammaproteobacteria bacterium]|nr:glutathione S-transferase family protein [Gammaproteobacteria bacterium]
MSLKLHVFPWSPRAFKVLWMAHYLELDYEFVLVDLTKGAQKTPEHLALNPNGRMPVLEEDGFVLWESNAIVDYLASKLPESGLLPTDTRERLSVEKWQFWDSSHWDAACRVLVYEHIVKPAFGLGEASPTEIARGNQLFERAARVLDGELSRHRYVAGETITVADFSIGSSFCVAGPAQYPLAPYNAIQRWFGELQAMPSWKKTVAMQRPT